MLQPGLRVRLAVVGQKTERRGPVGNLLIDVGLGDRQLLLIERLINQRTCDENLEYFQAVPLQAGLG